MKSAPKRTTFDLKEWAIWMKRSLASARVLRIGCCPGVVISVASSGVSSSASYFQKDQDAKKRLKTASPRVMR